MYCRYETDEETGITTVRFGGEAVVHIKEAFDEKQGEMRYFASNVKSGQKDFKAALEWAGRQVALSAVHAEFNKQNPRPKKFKPTLDDYNNLLAEVEAMRAKVAEADALKTAVAEAAKSNGASEATKLKVVRQRKTA